MRPKILLHVDSSLIAERIYLVTNVDAIKINERVINSYFKMRGRKEPLKPGVDGLFSVQLGKYFLLSITFKSVTRMMLVDHQLAGFQEFERCVALMEGTTGSTPSLVESFYTAKLNYHSFIDDFEISELDHPESKMADVRSKEILEPKLVDDKI